MGELVRVLRPGGTIAVTVPRWFPELINWALSDDYHNVPGGHVRIYRHSALVGRLARRGPPLPRHRLRPLACTRPTGGSSARSASATTITRW